MPVKTITAEVDGKVRKFKMDIPDDASQQEIMSAIEGWSTSQTDKPPDKPSAATRFGKQALSTIGGGLKAPFDIAGAAARSAKQGSPRPLWDVLGAPQVEQFKKAGGQLQRVAHGDLSGIPGAVMYGTAGALPGVGPLITSAVEQGTPVARGGEGDVPKALGTMAGGAAIAPIYKYGAKAIRGVPAAVGRVGERLGGPELMPSPAEGVTAVVSPHAAVAHYGSRQLGRLFKKTDKPPIAYEPSAKVNPNIVRKMRYGGPTEPTYGAPGKNIPRRGFKPPGAAAEEAAAPTAKPAKTAPKPAEKKPYRRPVKDTAFRRQLQKIAREKGIPEPTPDMPPSKFE